MQKKFVERQEDNSIKRVLEDDITSYDKVVELGNDIIDQHLHYKDWSKKSPSNDIIIHTTFEAKSSMMISSFG